MLTELTPIQHATAVSDELIDVIEKVPKVTKKKLLSNVKKAVRTIEHNPTLPIHAVTPPPTIEGGLADSEGEGESESFPHTTTTVTTTSNPTAPCVRSINRRTRGAVGLLVVVTAVVVCGKLSLWPPSSESARPPSIVGGGVTA